MEYPHWFGYFYTKSGDLLPFAVLLISREQATGAAESYAKAMSFEWMEEHLQRFDSLSHLTNSTGFIKEDLTILTDDERGRCVAFTYCDAPGGKCGMNYYRC